MKQNHEAFFNQLEGFRRYFLKVSDVTPGEAEIIPKGFKNNIRWNLGHVYNEQYIWIHTLTNENVDAPKEFDEWFGPGTTPENFTVETPSLVELRGLLNHQIAKIKEAYGERLEEVYPPTEMWNMTTLQQVLLWTSFHEGMHLQAIKDIKKCINT